MPGGDTAQGRGLAALTLWGVGGEEAGLAGVSAVTGSVMSVVMDSAMSVVTGPAMNVVDGEGVAFPAEHRAEHGSQGDPGGSPWPSTPPPPTPGH